MSENRFSFRKILVILVLCSVSVVVVYQLRVQYYTVRFVSLNNASALLYDTAWRLPLPAVGHLDFIRNSTLLGNTKRNSSVLEGNNRTEHTNYTLTHPHDNVTGNGSPGKTNTSRSVGDPKSGDSVTATKTANTTTAAAVRADTTAATKTTAAAVQAVNTSKPTETATNTSVHTSINATVTTTTPRPVLTAHPKPHTCKDPFRSEYTEKQNFLCCRPLGGLGNTMFVYASAYGIATKLNRTLVINAKSKLTQFFNLTARIVDDYDCVVRGSKGKSAHIDCAFDKTMFEIPKGDNYCVGVYLQSYKYFEHVRDDIIKQFTFKKEVNDKSKSIIDKAVETFRQRTSKTDQSQRPVLVGVHVRRGDLVNNKFGYDVATPEYLAKAMKYFRDKYGEVLFMVCSNGMDWVKKNVHGDDVIYVEGQTYDVDMALLLSCDHTLSTVGSFSWWVGYLTGGETVYYQWPAREQTPLRKHYGKDYSEFFPPSWIGMR